MKFQPIIVPGWKNSGPGHWQTRWAQCLQHAHRVEQPDWVYPEPATWHATVARYVDQAECPVLLVAHSLGCLAAVSLPVPLRAKVAGALLVAPPDVERPTAAPCIRDFGPVPLHSLPFQSVVVASDDDPYCALARAREFAHAWGSRLEILKGAGHINAESGFGDWQQGLKILAALRRRAVWRVNAPLPRVAKVQEVVSLP
ncbi:RBBP9/YdeN family alpha/beta hydrolase [Bordetella sp. 02P26C-1]|uniref:RBBP9/YdeN family alpha/beta hydrolase n=1 Tax=Bordetella sp. 02P26C-1 TaxID=2683195 RepID=UPI001354A0B0|nr:alpha/beta hydrolase [Bordetella sp. 02P26C-1]MVW79804.1 alpha/beta hydrolase [Bordetella sp. 02P26C-1]